MSAANLVIRVVAMPGDTNPDGDMFGGWVMSQMDLGAWIQARQHTHHRGHGGGGEPRLPQAGIRGR